MTPRFPRARAPEPIPASRLLPERPRRILVADDEHLVATEITLALSDLGYTTVPALDGASAVRLAHGALPDMALLDIEMPVCTGLAAAARIFQELAIPVVILSAYSDRDYVESAREAGVFGYLIKPVSSEQLAVGLDIAWARYSDFMAQRAATDHLRKRLEERKIVEKAKWILVSRQGLSEPDAIRHLLKRARDGRVSVTTIAAEMIAAEPV